MPKSKKTIPIYEYKEKVDGQIRYYIRPCINGKQITKRTDDYGNMWLGNEGYNNALKTISEITKNPNKENSNLTLKDLIEEFLQDIKKIRKTSTYNSYCEIIKNQIIPYFSYDTKFENITSKSIIEWHNKLDDNNLSLKYKQKSHTVLACILEKAKLHNIHYNVAKDVGNFQKNNGEVKSDKDKIRYITFEEFNTFISYVDDIMWKTFFTTLFYTGCRKGEIMVLNWNDIDFVNNEIIVNKTINTKIKGSYDITNTKNYENRKIKMSHQLKAQLQLYKNMLMENKNFNDHWFVFGNERYLPTTTIARVKDKYFKMSGVKRITIHEFRHSHVSLLINEYLKKGNTDVGKFFIMMSNRMGHTIEVMRETYMHLFPTIQDEIVNILDNLI